MMGKRLFWREFWLLWSAGVITSGISAALLRIPTTPLAAYLFLSGHSHKLLLVGTEAIELPVEIAIAVGCGLLAAHRIGLGAPIVEKWLRGETIKLQVRPLFVSSLVVGILLGAISMLPNLSVFHPNRQLAYHEAERLSESPQGVGLVEKLGTYSSGRLTLTSLSASYFSDAILGELISRLFLLSGIALILAKITGAPSGTASNGVLFSAVFVVAAISVVVDIAGREAVTQMIFRSLGVERVVHDPFWLVILRALLQTVPGAVGLGWLYVRRGIESAILAAFVAPVFAHVFLVLVLVRFVR